MRVLLIVPPIQDFFFTPVRAYPLGLLYLAQSLKQEGIEVKIINALEDRKKLTLPVPQELQYLKRYYRLNKSPFCLFSHYYHFGLRFDEIEDAVRSYKPQIIGIASNFSSYHVTSRELARRLKAIDKRIQIVMGGRFCSAAPEIVISDPDVDFVLRGEAESTFPALCRAYRGGNLKRIQGVCYRLKNKVVLSSSIGLIDDLDSLGIPDRTMIDYRRYRYKTQISSALITSRGCPLGCSFCAIRERFRVRSSRSVIQEIDECYSLGIRHFNFEDDTINLNREFEDILDSIIEKYSGQLTISFMNGVLSSLRSTLREKLIQAGLTHLDLSIATSVPKLAKRIHRTEVPARVFRLAEALLKHSKTTTVHFIIGFIGQTSRDVIKDLYVLARKPLFLGPSIFYPVIESSMFLLLQQEFGMRKEDHFYFRSSSAFFDKSLPRDSIFTFLYLSRIINFFKILIDQHQLTQDNFTGFLEKIACQYPCHAKVLPSKAALTRFDLGTVLLYKLLHENRIYRAEERRSDEIYNYHFYQEDFIDERFLEKFLKTLAVRGVLTKQLIAIKKGVSL